MVSRRFWPKLASLKQNFVAERPDSLLEEHLQRLQPKTSPPGPSAARADTAGSPNRAPDGSNRRILKARTLLHAAARINGR